MSKKLLLLTIFFLWNIFSASSCKEEKSHPDIVGTFSWQEWQKESGWKNHSANDYYVDTSCCLSLLNAISELENEIRFEIYASNWCTKDCEIQLPRMIKFLKTAGVSEEDIIIFGLNRTKTEPTDIINKWKEIFPNDNCWLPTIVIYLNNNVQGKVKCETSDFPEWQCEIVQTIIETD